MMDVGVVMLVKNEARRVEQALAPILDQFAEVVVYDTGSTDGTQDLLRERLGIEPVTATLDAARCLCLVDLRNRGLAALRTTWCMTLDADERLDPDGFRALRRARIPDDAHGLLLRWQHYPEGEAPFADYKCALFRQGVRKRGLIHDSVQPELRDAGLRATWADEVVLEHHPEARKTPEKRGRYRRRLACAMRLEPDVPRYPWFAGYQALREGREQAAVRLLRRAAWSDHASYPVERINAGIVLAWLQARSGAFAAAAEALERARKTRQAYRDDFEVAVNGWMDAWFRRADAGLDARDAAALEPPRFAC